MKSFVERTKAKMGDLQSQVTTGVTRMRGQLGRSLGTGFRGAASLRCTWAGLISFQQD